MIAVNETSNYLIIISDSTFHRIPLSYLENCDISLYTKWSPFTPFKRSIILLLGSKKYKILLPNIEIKPALEIIREKLFESFIRKEEKTTIPLEEEESMEDEFSKI